MVIKGRARGGPAALAVHLERRDTNEEVRVRELRGVTARDVLGALREMDCMGSPATSVRTLYHAAINTAPNERLTDEQKIRAADRLEKELGLTGQPRMIVEHLKKNREHMHIVFLRIDTDRMIAIPDSHNFRKHEIVARELEREFGHQIVQGAHVDREGKDRPERTPRHDEMQQAERSGLSPQEAKKFVTKLWNQADSGKAFAAAVAAEGWVLAKGDSRDFVLIDPAGETHSLARRIEGAKAADVRHRMADMDPATVPTLDEAKALQRQAIADRSKEKEKVHEPAKVPIILKVAAPVAADPAKPLLPADTAPRSHPLSISRPPKDCVHAPKPPKQPTQQPPSRKLQRVYAAAATITQRAYEKARGLFNKKKPPSNLAPLEQPQVTERSAAPVNAQVKRRSRVFQTEFGTVNSVPNPPRPASTKKKLTNRQLDEMIGRHSGQQSERRGPSR